MIFPNIDPVAFQLPIPFLGWWPVHWYSITWIIAFLGIHILLNRRKGPIDKDQTGDLMFWGLLGAIVGGRLGYMIFYGSQQLIEDPISVFYVWQGGLSFHGGLLGVLISCFILSIKWKVKFFSIMDFVAPAMPVGLGSVRIGNFINAELLGRPTELPWGMIFPTDPEGLLRHPSQLYQAFAEGVILFLIINLYAKKDRPVMATSSIFLISYGSLRFITEFFREPDNHIGFTFLEIFTRGQMLSIPMILIGLMLLFYSYKRTKKE